MGARIHVGQQRNGGRLVSDRTRTMPRSGRSLGADQETVLALQETAGNRAVASLFGGGPGVHSHSAGASVQRTQDEATTLENHGRQWNARVWMKQDFHAWRTQLLSDMNGLLAQWGAPATVGHGIFRNNPYDPVVRTGQALPYSAIVQSAQSQPDGGVQYARAFRAWYSSGTKKLTDLPPAMLALALITHWAEVGRGYSGEIAALRGWINEIANARDRATAAALWGDVNGRFSPSLTYSVDLGTEFEPDEDESDESDDDDRMDTDNEGGEERIPSKEVRELLRAAGQPWKRGPSDRDPKDERSSKRYKK